MNRTVYKIYRNGELLKGQIWWLEMFAYDFMIIEIILEIKKLEKDNPDSQFVMDVDNETGIISIDEYYYDEENGKDCWNFDIAKYEMKKFINGKAS